MNPHDRFYRDCQKLPRRKPRKCAEWLLIALILTGWLWMLGNCQQADQRAALVAQAER